MPAEAERCSVRSIALGESLAGTASVVTNWLLLEHPGPWGREALRSSRLPEGLGAKLRRLSGALGVRVVLIRRHRRRSTDAAVDCFLAHTGPDEPWLEHLRLQSNAELFGFDLSPLTHGKPPGVGQPDEEPMFLVCTHGRRDPCCAERGRPLVRALDLVHAERAWEVSHIGGDRFAGNLVCFPHGLYFGRLDPDEGVAASGAYANGRIDLEHYRGRSCYGFAVQAAETFLRRRLELIGVDDVRLLRTRRAEPGLVEAAFATPSGSFGVAVRVRPASVERQLTCHAPEAVSPPTYTLTRIDGEPGGLDDR